MFMCKKHPKKIIKEKYNVKRSQNVEKVEINNIIAKEFKERRNKGYFLVLESEERLTLKTMVKVGISPKRIEVPNHTEAFKKIKKWHTNTYNETIGAYIAGVKDIGDTNCVAGVWFDYCGGISGNKEMNPKKDIVNYFKHKLPADGSVFAYTFCFRTGTKVEHKYQDMYEMQRHSQEEALENGYVLVRIPPGKMYSGSMFFEMWEVRKLK